MSTSTINEDKQQRPKRVSWLREQYPRMLALLFVLAITAGIFLFRERIAEFEHYGYLGAFLISLTCNATIILPAPGLLVLLALGSTLNPVAVGLAGGVGAALGELSGYLAGYTGRAAIENQRLYPRVESWMRRNGSVTIFIFTLLPFFPFDLAGIAAGALRFPLWKFFLICWSGRTLAYILVIFLGWEAVLRFLT